MKANQIAQVEWSENGTPVSTLFDDPYFSVHDGYAETEYVFLSGNGLPERFRPGFHIAELGFGTGLNLMVTAEALRSFSPDLHIQYTSFEAFPMSVSDNTSALAHFPISNDIIQTFSAAWGNGKRNFVLPGLSVTIIEGDARRNLPRWQGMVDAWFLDGFSPAKNPEMWEQTLMAELARHTAPGGTFSTFTAAGGVRRALADAGFEVQRIPGYGRKRHMTVGQIKDAK